MAGGGKNDIKQLDHAIAHAIRNWLDANRATVFAVRPLVDEDGSPVPIIAHDTRPTAPVPGEEDPAGETVAVLRRPVMVVEAEHDTQPHPRRARMSVIVGLLARDLEDEEVTARQVQMVAQALMDSANLVSIGDAIAPFCWNLVSIRPRPSERRSDTAREYTRAEWFDITVQSGGF